MFSLWQMLTMWAKKLLLPQLQTKLDQQDVEKETAKICQDKVWQSFKIPCFTGKSVRYARPVGQRWMPQYYRDSNFGRQKNFGLLFRQPDVLFLGNISSSGVTDRAED